MSFDLSWLWNLLNSISATINSWFSSVWSQALNIANTGQGIFSGLVAFGSQIWDAITKAFSVLGQWIGSAYGYLRDGIQNFASVFGQWLNSAYTYLAQGVSWIGSQFYNLGNWLYNAFYTTWNWIVNTIVGAWNNLVAWFSGVATAIGSWWGSVTTGINTWFTDLLKGFRQKIVQTIQADITISMAWKSGERFLLAKDLRDIPFGLMGIVSAPVIGRLVGEIVNAVVPLPSSVSYPLIPTIPAFSYTPPSLVVTTPTEKAVPTPTVSGQPAGLFTGLSTAEMKALSESYEVNITAGQDLSRQAIVLEYASYLGYSDEYKFLEALAESYETEVTP